MRKKIQSFFANEMLQGYLFVLPLLFVMIGLIGYPFLLAIWLSLTDKMVARPAHFVGFANYWKLFHDAIFLKTVRNSCIYTFVGVALKFVLGMGMALTLNHPIKGRLFFRGLLLLPWVIPTVASCLIWFWLFNDMQGVINAVLTRTGILKVGFPWLSSSKTALYSLILVQTWRGMPFYGINFLAGLQTIPKVLYDAAKVDGASAVKRFVHVTVPGLRSVMMVVLLLSTIWSFNEFQIIYILTRGGPGSSTQVFATLTYDIAIRGLRLGRGIAVSLSLFPFLAVIIVVLSKILGKE